MRSLSDSFTGFSFTLKWNLKKQMVLLDKSYMDLKVDTTSLPCVNIWLWFWRKLRHLKEEASKNMQCDWSFCQPKWQAFNPLSMTTNKLPLFSLPFLLFCPTTELFTDLLMLKCFVFLSFHPTYNRLKVGGPLFIWRSETLCQNWSLTTQSSIRREPRRYKERFVWEAKRAESTEIGELVQEN